MIFGVQWYYWLILLAAAVAAVILWRKALKTSKERRERLKKEAEIWKRDYDLRQEFPLLTDEIIKNTPDSRLLHGAAMNIQISLENETDMDGAFNAMPIEKKYIYTLEYFNEDAKSSLTAFFKKNGAPLTPLAADALDAIGYGEVSAFVRELFPMYDENSEVSIDYKKVTLTDERFKVVFDSNRLCDLAASYIRKNKNIFIN